MANVLLVEDNKAQAKASTDVLVRAGHTVTLATDGKSAIKSASAGGFDLVLLDLVLPDMQGDRICKWLKGNEGTQGIPVVMLTAKGSVSDRVTGLEAGADDYIEKPYNESELNARIGACLRTKRLQDELRQKNEELQGLLSEVERLAITDHLTGLFNRRHFSTILGREFETTKRYQSPLSCFMLDIDHFKEINDSFGHSRGDTVLREISALMGKTMRNVDIIARWGGEEFVVLLPQTGQEAALDAAGRLLNAVSSHCFKGLDKRKVTVSIGVCTIPQKAIDNAEAFVNAADHSLYEAKAGGRDRVAVYGPAPASKAPKKPRKKAPK